MKKFLGRVISAILLLLVMIISGMFSAFAVTLDDVVFETVTDEAKAVSPALVGIDVSSHNGNINWEAVKSSGVKFAMLRMFSHVPDTPNYVLDSKFEANVAGARAQGIHLGVYFFSYARNIDDVRNEANMVVNELKKYPGVFSFPIVFDAETGDTQDGFDITSFAGDACQTFCNILEQNGYYAMVYSNTYWFNNVINASQVSGLSLWQANYFNKYKGYTPSQAAGLDWADKPVLKNNNQNVYMWQFTDEGSVSGISGDADINVAYRDFSYIITEGGFNGYEKQGEGHVCSYSNEEYDLYNHYIRCRCGAVNEASVQPHTLNISTTDTKHIYSCSCGYVDASKSGDHLFDKMHIDNDFHYGKCSCGYVNEGSKAPHILTLSTTDSEHTYSCSCGYVNETLSGDHVWSKIYSDANFHYSQCECGYVDQSSKIAHSMGEQEFDSGSHYTECECGYRNSEPHQYGEYLYNETAHWQECACGFKTVDVEHVMSQNKCTLCDYHVHSGDEEKDFDENVHWIKCNFCTEAPREAHTIEGCACTECGYVQHDCEVTADCESHWDACKNCEYEGEKIDHNMSGVVCIDCGFFGHIYDFESDGESHWKKCITCSEVIDKLAHEFVDGECGCGYSEPTEETDETKPVQDGEITESDETEENELDTDTISTDSDANEDETDGGDESEAQGEGCGASFGGFGICMAVACAACVPMLKKKKY